MEIRELNKEDLNKLNRVIRFVNTSDDKTFKKDFNKYLKSANRFITSNSSTTNKIKVSLVSCIDGDTAKFGDDLDTLLVGFLYHLFV